MRIESVGNATLYLADCFEVLPTLPKAGAIVTDPPYGIAHKWKGGFSGKHGWGNSATQAELRNEWDERPLDAAAIDLLLSSAEQHVIWGGNYFPLPPSRCWLVWNKPERGFTLAEAELAWTNKDAVVRVFDGNRSEPSREHPTQKPVALMEWCVAKTEGVVVDPFMGSGTTGVACANLQRPFVGIESQPKYFEIALRRIKAAYSQGRLFA